MAFFGKTFVLDSQENFDTFVNSLPDVSAEYKHVLINHKSTVKLSKNGDDYVFESSKPVGGVQTFTFKSGVEFDEQLGKNNEHAAKTTFTVDGNTVTQVQKFPNGVVFTTTRVFSDDKLETTIKTSFWDGAAKRVYKAA